MSHAEGSIISFCLFVRTVAGDNQREHWTAKAARAKLHRRAVALVGRRMLKEARGWEGWNVKLTRISPRKLDSHDNLRSAMKHIADEVTRQLGLENDRDERLRFTYEQERGRPKEYAVRIEVW